MTPYIYIYILLPQFLHFLNMIYIYVYIHIYIYVFFKALGTASLPASIKGISSGLEQVLGTWSWFVRYGSVAVLVVGNHGKSYMVLYPP